MAWPDQAIDFKTMGPDNPHIWKAAEINGVSSQRVCLFRSGVWLCAMAIQRHRTLYRHHPKLKSDSSDLRTSVFQQSSMTLLRETTFFENSSFFSPGLHAHPGLATFCPFPVHSMPWHPSTACSRFYLAWKSQGKRFFYLDLILRVMGLAITKHLLNELIKLQQPVFLGPCNL